MTFGRQVRIEFGTPGKPGVSIPDLRVSFRVRHTITGGPSKASITVWNLSKTSVAALQEPDVRVRLVAGYDQPRTIFEGDPIKAGVRSERRGPDRITVIDAHDGGRALSGTHLDMSFSEGVTLNRLVQEVAQRSGLPLGVVALTERALPGGFRAVGPVRKVMDEVAALAGGSWTVQDGALTVIERGASTGSGPLFSAANKTLIGSPTRKDSRTIEITALLDNRMRPGQLFAVESEGFTGTYQARDVSFVGDSGYAAAYYVKVVGRERRV